MTENLQEVSDKLKSLIEPHGFEAYPFKISWYNEKVDDKFVLQYSPDTVAFIIISTPSLFEKGFRKFLSKSNCLARDPIDECISFYFDQVKQLFPQHSIDTIHDYELHHSKRPKVLVQTAGHVAGAARYYQRKDVVPDAWEPEKKIFGVSVHPKYGGWFALRGVIIFKTLNCPELQQMEPPDAVSTREKRIELLERFNGNWQDWTFRDIIDVDDRYSEDQKMYFATAPKDRKGLIERLKRTWIDEGGDKEKTGLN